MNALRHGAGRWGIHSAEARENYPCDDVLPHAPGRWLRAVDVRAEPGVVFRWVCQLRAAPYSYDLLDNFGRRSPRHELPWCQDLAIGQSVMTIFTVVGFVPDEHLTVRMKPGRPRAVFGDLALTYRVVPAPGGSRLIAAMRVGDPPGPAGALRRKLLAGGDLLMMRKQLLTLAQLAGG